MRAFGFVFQTFNLIPTLNALQNVESKLAPTGLPGSDCKPVVLVEVHHAEGRFAQPHGAFEHGIEHRRKVARRGVDYLQHLSCRRLLFERLPLLRKQSRILHRDHSLRGEILHQRDFLVGEWPHLLPIDRNDTKQGFVLPERNDNACSRAPEINQSPAQRAHSMDFSFG